MTGAFNADDIATPKVVSDPDFIRGRSTRLGAEQRSAVKTPVTPVTPARLVERLGGQKVLAPRLKFYEGRPSETL